MRNLTIKLSILDQSPIGEGENAEQGLKNTVKLAQAADSLGYNRFWVSEHHNNDQLAGSAPESLIGFLLASTKNIRIGSGGVMLQHYSPYKVAEVFHVLSALAPDRVDLGVGKAPGGLSLSTKALQEDKREEQKSFEEKLADLHSFINDEENVLELKAAPAPKVKPDIFLLGGSAESAELAAKLGISFVFAYFINGEENILKEARDRFKQFSPNGGGEFLLALTVAVADSDEQADSYIKQRESVKVIFADGRKLNVGSLEQAEKVISQAGESEYQLLVQKAGYVAGSKENVRKELTLLAEKYEIGEIISLSPIVNIEDRIYSYKLLTEAFAEDSKLKQKNNQGVGI